jgi:hypothetical protein
MLFPAVEQRQSEMQPRVPPLTLDTSSRNAQPSSKGSGSQSKAQQVRPRSVSPTMTRSSQNNSISPTKPEQLQGRTQGASRPTVASITQQRNYVPAPAYFDSFHSMNTANNNSFMNNPNISSQFPPPPPPHQTGVYANFVVDSTAHKQTENSNNGDVRDSKWDLFEPSPRGTHFAKTQQRSQSAPRPTRGQIPYSQTPAQMQQPRANVSTRAAINSMNATGRQPQGSDVVSTYTDEG